MNPLRSYKLPDGTVRQYREGEQPAGSVLAAVRIRKQTPESRMKDAGRRKENEQCT